MPAFGPDLFPGMTAVPIGVVPKPHSDKLQLIIDPSTGLHSPNSLIPWAAVSVPLDNLHHLGAHLIAAKKGLNPSTHLIIFKSDVSGIYCHLPMHFLWQLFQVITINGMRHIDWNYNFGNQGAGGLWRSFIGLVLWITTQSGTSKTSSLMLVMFFCMNSTAISCGTLPIRSLSQLSRPDSFSFGTSLESHMMS